MNRLLHHHRRTASMLPALALAVATSSGLAGERRIYKSIDENGVVTYSQLPPQSAAERVETLRIDPPPPDGGSAGTAQGPRARQPAAQPLVIAPPNEATAKPQSGTAAGEPSGRSAGEVLDGAGGQSDQTRPGQRLSRPAGAASPPERGRAVGTAPSRRTSR